MARMVEGAVVSDNSQYYWAGWSWQPLVVHPSEKAPGLLSRERTTLPKLIEGRTPGEMRAAGEALRARVTESGTYLAHDGHWWTLDGRQWFDGDHWHVATLQGPDAVLPEVQQPRAWVRNVEALPQEPAVPVLQRPMEVEQKVKVYKSAKDMQHDSRKMMRSGWRVASQSAVGHRSMGGAGVGLVLAGPLGAMVGARREDTFEVVWERTKAG